MTQTLESEVSIMCNLSKGVEEKGIEKGRQEGKRKCCRKMPMSNIKLISAEKNQKKKSCFFVNHL